VGVVGAGFVGASFAYALMMRGIATELVLVDARRDKAEGEAMDLNHGLQFTRPMRIYAGDYADLAGTAVVVLTAGASQRPGETRLELLERNAAIFREIVPRIVSHNPEGILLIATNPVDLLTYISLGVSGLAPSRVIGSGTILDTARFRYLLGEHYRVDPRSVHAFIIGEHGDSELPVWSTANIAGIPLGDLPQGFDEGTMERLFEGVRGAAHEIIRRKGATYYAIGLGLLSIVEAIVGDHRTVLSVSTLMQGQYGVRDICLSLPAVVGRQGIVEVLELPLNDEEQERFRGSAEAIRQWLPKVGLK
jgi:L-lactate dehydrogenase